MGDRFDGFSFVLGLLAFPFVIWGIVGLSGLLEAIFG